MNAVPLLLCQSRKYICTFDVQNLPVNNVHQLRYLFVCITASSSHIWLGPPKIHQYYNKIPQQNIKSPFKRLERRYPQFWILSGLNEFETLWYAWNCAECPYLPFSRLFGPNIHPFLEMWLSEQAHILYMPNFEFENAGSLAFIPPLRGTHCKNHFPAQINAYRSI